MVWVAALPPWLATIGASTASATIFSSWPSNRPSTEDARKAVARLTSSQLKRPLAMVQTLSDNSSSLVTPPSAFRSSSASSSITSTTSSMVMTPTSRFVGIDHGGGDQIVFAEQPRHLFLVVQDGHAAAVFVDQIGQRHRPARAQQRIQRYRALPVLRVIDRVDFVEPVRQVRRVAHVVDRLPDGPVRRHRDEFGLHPPPGGIFRIKQAALERIALRGRQFLEDFLLVLFVEALEQFDGVVGFQFANAFGDGFRLEFLEDFLADGVVDFVERRKVEIRRRSIPQG